MTNGAMNVEIGNPAYKIYEGDPDDDAGELLDSDFALDPDKVVQLKAKKGEKSVHPNYRNTYPYFLLWVFSRAVLFKGFKFNKVVPFQRYKLAQKQSVKCVVGPDFFFFLLLWLQKKC